MGWCLFYRIAKSPTVRAAVVNNKDIFQESPSFTCFCKHASDTQPASFVLQVRCVSACCCGLSVRRQTDSWKAQPTEPPFPGCRALITLLPTDRPVHDSLFPTLAPSLPTHFSRALVLRLIANQ